jgi:hypothetical protein
VAAMHAIEIADRNHGRGKRRWQALGIAHDRETAGRRGCICRHDG